MGLDVRLEMDGQGVLFTFCEVLRGEEIYAASEALYTPESLSRLRYQLVDLTQVSRIEISTDQIQALAALDCQAAEQAGGFLVASVVGHDLQESISQFYRAYISHPDIEAKIFRTLHAARFWLQQKLSCSDVETVEGF